MRIHLNARARTAAWWRTLQRPRVAGWHQCQADAGAEEGLEAVRVARSDADAADRSRIVRPVLYEAVEAIHANLLNAMFPADEKFFSVLGKTETDHKNAGIIEEFLRKDDGMGA